MELAPILDVVFVLLTFFVYSVAMMIEADVLPVRLTALAAGSGGAGGAVAPGRVDAITIDKAGKLFFNRQPVTDEQLHAQLLELTKTVAKPRVYLGMEARGDTDRGPLLISLIERVQKAGISDFVIVGQKPK